MSDLDIRALHKEFDGFTAISPLNLKVKQGEFVALLGPSGCGKSTLLKLLAGLESPTSGRIFLDDKDLTPLAPSQRNISMVFQSYALFPHLSVKENILFGLKARKVDKRESHQRLEQVLDQVSLKEQQHKLPSQLSGGQRQRVALARAIVSQHPICLMDEPLSNLDAKLRAEMRAEIRALQKKLGLTMIYVTHDQVEAMSMADKIVLLDQGKVQQIGTPQALYNHPENIFTARFIGSPAMNVFSLPNQQQLIGVRPENITLDATGIPAKIVHIDYHGDSTLLKVSLDNSVDLMVKVEKYQNLSIGDSVFLNWEISDQHQFFEQNGTLAPSVTGAEVSGMK